MSTRAQSEEDYTQVIETCRRAQASEASPAAAQFAKNLIAWSLNRRGQLKAEAGHDKEAILDFDDAIRNDATLLASRAQPGRAAGSSRPI